MSQELNLPPYIFNLYTEVILVASTEKNDSAGGMSKEYFGTLGLTRQEVLAKHYAVYGRMLDNTQLRQQILPMLETSGLIIQEQDPSDKRKMLIYPSHLLQSPTVIAGGSSETEGGVKDEEITNVEEFSDSTTELI